jgi:hypothetical protein
MGQTARVAFGIIIGPMVAALILSLPALLSLELLLPTFLWNLAVWYPLFLLCGALSHIILKRKQTTRLRDYVRVMFWVGTAVLTVGRLAALQWVFGNGGSEFHLGTQVLSGGHFTVGGIVLTVVESMLGALVLVFIFAVFWSISVKAHGSAT